MSTSRADENADPAAEEARGESRRRAFLAGMIVSRDGSQSLGCTLRDISHNGARIVLPGAAAVPARVYLIESRHPAAWDAHIVWRNGLQAGLAFTGELRLSPDMDAGLQFLWRLYRELGPRATNPFDF